MVPVLLSHPPGHENIFLQTQTQLNAADDLEIRDVELVVGGDVVGTCGGHHHLVPGLLARLLPRRRNQPEFSHGCCQRGTVDSTGSRIQRIHLIKERRRSIIL